MERFPFDHRKMMQQGNGKVCTVHGAIELYQGFPQKGFISLDIRGPAGAHRGTAIIDKATARRVAVTLLRWAMT